MERYVIWQSYDTLGACSHMTVICHTPTGPSEDYGGDWGQWHMTVICQGNPPHGPLKGEPWGPVDLLAYAWHMTNFFYLGHMVIWQAYASRCCKMVGYWLAGIWLSLHMEKGFAPPPFHSWTYDCHMTMGYSWHMTVICHIPCGRPGKLAVNRLAGG